MEAGDFFFRKEHPRRCDSLSTNSSSSSDVRDLPSGLTDNGLYCYAAVISFQLHKLFFNDWDKNFCIECISTLQQHLNLSEKVKPDLLNFLNGVDIHNFGVYKKALLHEKIISGKTAFIIQDLVYLAVKEGNYDARMRVLIHYLSGELNIPPEIVDLYEVSAVDLLRQNVQQLSEEEQKEIEKKARKRKIKRYALIGLATIGGGAVLGLSGGLAAPLIGAGVGTILGASTATVLGSTAGIAIIGSLFGAAGAGLTGFKMKKRIGEVEEFSFGTLNKDPTGYAELHVTIAISGWLKDDEPDSFKSPWRTLFLSREQYYLRYESRYLLELGKAMEYIFNFALSMAALEALKFTVLNGVIRAIAWPANLVTLANLIDNPWSVCCVRSVEVGKQLAEVLLGRSHGHRPVTLIGYSIGARVIYYCLREMSEREDCEGIIQDAILLGTPVSGTKHWNKFTRVVAGKIINGYSKSDWLLKFIYRTLSMKTAVAGLNPIEIDDRRFVNLDLTEMVSGHTDYPNKMDEILKYLNLNSVDDHPMTFEYLMKKSSSDLSTFTSTVKINPLRRTKSDETMYPKRKETFT